jgi:hypothetical protein
LYTQRRVEENEFSPGVYTCILFTNENEENAKRDSNKNFLFILKKKCCEGKMRRKICNIFQGENFCGAISGW